MQIRQGSPLGIFQNPSRENAKSRLGVWGAKSGALIFGIKIIDFCLKAQAFQRVIYELRKGNGGALLAMLLAIRQQFIDFLKANMEEK